MWCVRGLCLIGGGMTYLVNSIFYTLQGEGYWSGRPAVFCRFSRCNLWTGREEDRAKSVCWFCDTDFLHGDRYGLGELVSEITRVADGCRFIVFTGGEPALQLNEALIDELHDLGFYIAVETNGTKHLHTEIDWVCVSPKENAPLRVTDGDELKLVYPQREASPERFEGWAFDHFWLSPIDGPDLQANTAAAVEYVLAHPRWRLNVQTHKVIGVK